MSTTDRHVRTRRRFHRVAALAAIAVAFGVPAPLGALLDSSGAPIANTGTGGTGQLAGGPTVEQKLLDPSSPADDSPAALAALGSVGDPESDLADALAQLSSAGDASTATDARTRALAILEGAPLDKKTYSGIPLLNWNAPAKVKTVPAGGTVDVREVRFGEHSITDTFLLEFADPAQPFTITYHISELGLTTFGGAATPSPLLIDGTTPVGGLSSTVLPLATDLMPTGTSEINRFHPGGAAELARHATQTVTVRMPPPRMLDAVLDPDVRPGHERVTTLRPASPDRLAALAATFGFSGNAPTDQQRDAAIALLANTSPEKQLWTALRALDPASPTFLADANTLGVQNAPLVAAMRSRFTLPGGVPTNAAATIGVALLNNEAYASRRQIVRGGAVTVAVTNADQFTHTFTALDLHRRRAVFGAHDWGEFAWSALGAPVTLAPGATQTLTVRPAADSFALWLGDLDSGDQAGTTIAVASATVESISVGNRSDAATGGVSPAHVTMDATGHAWVAVGGIDSIMRFTPGTTLASSTSEVFHIPGGVFDGSPPLQAPHDITIDGNGILWVTLFVGNGIARIDPARVVDGTESGIQVFRMPVCDMPLPLCMGVFPGPPPPHPPPSRLPDQLKVMLDADGNTVVWFTQGAADAIGLLHVSATGNLLHQTEIPCDCGEPKGVALGPDGSVWFTENVTNAIGRIVPDQARPFDPAAASVSHVQIPSGVLLTPPPHPGVPPQFLQPFRSSGPHSVGIDNLGRVWFTEEETAKLGFFDPAALGSGVAPITELDLGTTEFGAPVAPADFAIDRANRVFFVDEYGDIIGSATDAGLGERWRPGERASLTDSPMVAPNGDVWITETAANLITRVSSVSAGVLPAGRVPTLTADIAAGAVRGEGLRGVATVDVTVLRDGRTIASSLGVPVVGGAFAAGTGTARPFAVDAPPTPRGGDVVVVAPRGPFPAAPVRFTVAALSAEIQGNGGVAGHVLLDGRPAAGSVVVSAAPGNSFPIVDLSDGSWNAKFIPALSLSAPGTASFATATAAGLFRTVAPLAPHPSAFPTLPPADRDAPATAPLPVRNLVDPPGPAPARPSALDRACRDRLWLTVDGVVPMLGMHRELVTRCMGAPDFTTSRGNVWRYGRTEVRFRRGTVAEIVLKNAFLTTEHGNLHVGSSAAALAEALPDATRRGRIATANLPHAGHGFGATVKIALGKGRNPRINTITITRSR